MTTTSNLSMQVMARSPLPPFTPVTPGPSDVVVRPQETFQPFLGTGAALTDSAAYVLTNYLSTTHRSALLGELFSPGQCNWQMLRVCMGSPDFRAQPVGYTYDDMPKGQTDPHLAHFSVSRGTAYITPLITQILAINPDVRILAAPGPKPRTAKAAGQWVRAGIGMPQNSTCWPPGMPAPDAVSMAASISLRVAPSASAARIAFRIATARPRGPRRSARGEYGSRRRAR